MKKIMFIYGGLSGAIVISLAIASVALSSSETDWTVAEYLGYLVMLIALSIIFMGIKRYRDQELGGVIRFGTALGLGLGIALVASLVYVVAWEGYLAISGYEFMNQYAEGVLRAEQAAGASEEALAAMRSEMEAFQLKYANPLFRLGITFLEIFPVGLLISLVSAAVLRNSNILPARG
ncbi:MAG: DUF4199 domain-containing protein [Xanthomonadales bacterium]|nr:DUF4199 domain-containing protein [Xanthomonadales bacterium]